MNKNTKSASNYIEYNSWKSMISRCYNPKNVGYKNYGDRGIIVCDRWRESFFNFLEDMGQKPSSKHTIERKDSNKGYDKENCKWATVQEQNRNRTNTILFNVNGESKIIKDLISESKVSYSQIYRRLKMGWTIEQAVNTPKMRDVSEYDETIKKLHNEGVSQCEIGRRIGRRQSFVYRRLQKINSQT